MSRGGELRLLLKQVRDAGGRAERSNSGHWKIYRGDVLITTVANSPSDGHRAMRNARATLRRAGLAVPG